MRWVLIVVVASLSMLMMPSGRASAAENQLAIVPDAGLQKRIERAVHTMGESKTPVREQFAAVGSLWEDARDDERFFEQLFHYYSTHFDTMGDGQRVAIMKIVGMLDVSRIAIAKVAVRYAYSDDKTLRGIARSFLAIVEETGLPSLVNFSYFEAPLAREPPLDLVRYIYERSPGEALLSMARRYAEPPKRKELVWAEHVVSEVLWKQKSGFLDRKEVEPEAMAQLEKLSKDEAWWVRLYVAEIMRQHPAFRTAELLDRLKSDPHELVREAMSFAREKPKQPGKTPGSVTTPSTRAEQGKK